ncbi:hypothetical protein A0O34_21560 [Chryseobacterium glaciei]|uniref:Uncharacterized protein n=1 Tax=Chryseobacterium glaciei TaxID=1685010 RepID=A0A172Y1D0_9FLAO|nr:DUF6520 family protein [Chryseobacterium glaciei]ANF52950.1 hypothetical protein A0O34_21560 [Chryseobacterium glaciei]
MKNFKLLLATAVLFAVGSAFTASSKTVAGEYVKDGDTWELKDGGTCELEPSEVCDYTKIGSATTEQYPDQFQNPANFSAHTINARYEP